MRSINEQFLGNIFSSHQSYDSFRFSFTLLVSYFWTVLQVGLAILYNLGHLRSGVGGVNPENVRSTKPNMNWVRSKWKGKHGEKKASFHFLLQEPLCIPLASLITALSYYFYSFFKCSTLSSTLLSLSLNPIVLPYFDNVKYQVEK